MSNRSTELYEKVVKHFGGQQKTADALDIAQPSVSAWLTGKNQMSAVVAFKIEHITQGKFKAPDLCPKLTIKAA